MADLEQDLANYKRDFDALEVVEITDADFLVTPPSERVPPSPANILVVSIPGVDQFGSNDQEMTPSNVANLQASRVAPSSVPTTQVPPSPSLVFAQDVVDTVTGETLAPLFLANPDECIAPS